VPGNAKALVYVPAKDAKDVTEGGKKAASVEGVRFLRMEGGRGWGATVGEPSEQ
jgi:hypothetical protein